VKHLVLSSVANANKHTGIPHFESKARIEEALKAQGVPYTILRPAFFMVRLVCYVIAVNYNASIR
jgi:uncharacterized protein YbjT (DUF2867 family)